MRLFIIRIKNQKNPFSADRNHLHHYLSKKYDFLKSNINNSIDFIYSIYIEFAFRFYELFNYNSFSFIFFYDKKTKANFS